MTVWLRVLSVRSCTRSGSGAWFRSLSIARRPALWAGVTQGRVGLAVAFPPPLLLFSPQAGGRRLMCFEVGAFARSANGCLPARVGRMFARRSNTRGCGGGGVRTPGWVLGVAPAPSLVVEGRGASSLLAGSLGASPRSGCKGRSVHPVTSRAWARAEGWCSGICARGLQELRQGVLVRCEVRPSCKWRRKGFARLGGSWVWL